MTRSTQVFLAVIDRRQLTVRPARAQEPRLSDSKTELDELKKQLNEMKVVQRQMADVILGRYEGLRPEDAGLQKRLDTLAESIRKLDERVTTIGDRFAPMPRMAGSSPIAAGPPAAHGTVRL